MSTRFVVLLYTPYPNNSGGIWLLYKGGNGAVPKLSTGVDWPKSDKTTLSSF